PPPACHISAQRGEQQCTVSLGHSGSPIHGKSRRCRLGHVISCFQSQLITCKQGNAGYRHFSPTSCNADSSALMISPRHRHLSVSISTSSQCSSMPPASAHQCHINATYQFPSVPHQCYISVPI
ncbi:unnamed protein product, partial [Staurois parvus]